jgi:hypothetical protein
MGLGACCKYFCYLLLALLALLLAPLASHRPKLVKLADVKQWGLKGPYAASLPKNMLGVYYLDGNQAPWGPGKCNSTENKERDLCRNGYKRSQLILWDSTHQSYDRASGRITQYPSGFGVTDLAKFKGGMPVAYMLQLIRAGYIWDKKDPEFASRPADYFEGRMKLYMGWVGVGDLVGVDYRVTAEDENGDGSSIARFTWRDQPYDKPASKADAFKEYEYKMVRILDSNGKVNWDAIKRAESIYGPNVIFAGI